MVKPTSIRLKGDIDKFVDLMVIGDETKTDTINRLLQKAKEDKEKGTESTTEARIKEPTTENPQITPETEKQAPTLPAFKFDYEKWTELRNSVCPDCRSEPSCNSDDHELYVYCPKPNFIGKGKAKGTRGNTRIEECLNTLNWYQRHGSQQQEHASDQAIIAHLQEELLETQKRLTTYDQREIAETSKNIRELAERKTIVCPICPNFSKIIPMRDCFKRQSTIAEIALHLRSQEDLRCPCPRFQFMLKQEMQEYLEGDHWEEKLMTPTKELDRLFSKEVAKEELENMRLFSKEQTEAETEDTNRRLAETQNKFDATKEKLKKLSPEELAEWNGQPLKTHPSGEMVF